MLMSKSSACQSACHCIQRQCADFVHLLQPSQKATAENVLEKIRSYTNQLPNTSEVSVVTAYFNLGNLNKQSSEGDLFSV